MRVCGNCIKKKRSVNGDYFCLLLHAAIFLNDDGCIYHETEDDRIIDQV